MIYEVTLVQSYYDQQVINRWNYLSSGVAVGVTASFALISAMGFVPVSGAFPAGTIAAALQTLQPPTLKYFECLAKALYDDPTDFYDNAFPTGIVGTQVTSDSSSPAFAYGMKTNRVRTDIARGTKRFAGVTESTMDGGGVINAPSLALIQAVADLMSDTLTYAVGGSSLSFAPVVAQKEMYTVPPAPKAYRYYGTLAEQLTHIAQGIIWTPYPQIRTQVSRQYGHGA